MNALMIPRPISRGFLILICLGIGQAAWSFLDVKLLAFVSGQAVAVCTMCLAAVWSFREKATDVLGDIDLGSDDMVNAQKYAKALGAGTIRRSVWVGFCALLAGGPAAASQLAGYVMQWMVLLSTAAVAEALYALWITSHLGAQVQDWRDEKKVEIREADERRTQLERVQNSIAMKSWREGRTQTEEVPAGELKPFH